MHSHFVSFVVTAHVNFLKITHRSLLQFVFRFSLQVTTKFNPHLPNGLSHHYHLDGSTSNFRGIRSIFSLLFHYAPNFEVDRAYWFRVVCASVHPGIRTSARVLKFHIWIPHGKIVDACFFSCPSYLPFWYYAPLKKSE